jgi:type II secretory pathway pseudopilin PulG
MRTKAARQSQKGFTLVETMIAAAVMMVGIMSLAAILASSIAYMSVSEDDYIAQQKASEAVESIFTARDQGQATWSTICNVGSAICSNGIFLTGSMPLCNPNADGIIGTQDDFNGAACAGGLVNTDSILVPNAAGTFNPPVEHPLSNFSRTITITNVVDSSGNLIANLREIQVTITYTSGNFKNRTYTLTSYISNFS